MPVQSKAAPRWHRRLLEEKSTTLEQLAARSQAQEALELQVKRLTAVTQDRLALQEAKSQVGPVHSPAAALCSPPLLVDSSLLRLLRQVDAEARQLRAQLTMQERMRAASEHQLLVAKQLLKDVHDSGEHGLRPRPTPAA